MRTRKSKNSSEVISFRFRDDEQRAEFLQRAKAHGLSPGDLARLYVTAALEAAMDQTELREQMEQLLREVQATRSDLSRATLAILEHGGKTQKTVAKTFVANELNRPV